jgi:hypothetical protein
MESEEDSMRFLFQDMISKRVIAVQQPGQRCDATIDGASVCFDEDDGLSGHDALLPRVLQFALAAAAKGDLEELNDPKCAVCMCSMYEKRSDGGVAIDAREMKCPGRHTFHSCCAKSWFVNAKHNSCPLCRHNFCGALVEALKIAEEIDTRESIFGHYTEAC